MTDQDTKPSVCSSLKRKTSSSAASASTPPKKRNKVIPGSSLPPQGFTGTVLAANHPTVVYELLERVLEEATAEHGRIVAERYGFDSKHLHFAWRTIKKNALKTLKQGT